MQAQRELGPRAWWRLAGLDEHLASDRQPQRAVGRPEDRVKSLVDAWQRLLDICHGGRAGQLGGTHEPLVDRLALGVIDVARDDNASEQQGDTEDERDAERQPAAETAHRQMVVGGSESAIYTRNMKPTPRTVSRTRGSPAASSLRRR